MTFREWWEKMRSLYASLPPTQRDELEALAHDSWMSSEKYAQSELLDVIDGIARGDLSFTTQDGWRRSAGLAAYTFKTCVLALVEHGRWEIHPEHQSGDYFLARPVRREA